MFWIKKGLEQSFSNTTSEPRLKIRKCITAKPKRKRDYFMGQLLWARITWGVFTEHLILTVNLQDLWCYPSQINLFRLSMLSNGFESDCLDVCFNVFKIQSQIFFHLTFSNCIIPFRIKFVFVFFPPLDFTVFVSLFCLIFLKEQFFKKYKKAVFLWHVFRLLLF